MKTWAEVYGWQLNGEITSSARFKVGGNIIHAVTRNGITYHANVTGYTDSLFYPMTLRFYEQPFPRDENTLCPARSFNSWHP